jgi:hypothetical protein
MLEVLDIELFISEIQKYPEIWDLTIESYHDRKKKRSAWLKVCRAFCDDFEEKEDKEKTQISKYIYIYIYIYSIFVI